MANRRFYWMKLPGDYFKQLIQKKMRKQPDGAEMQLIYLKMLLYCMDKDAAINFQEVFDSIEEEIAEEIGEEAEAVKKTIAFLEANKKLERTESGIVLPEAFDLVGSEGTSAERMRRLRERQTSQSDSEALQCDATVTGCNATVTDCNKGVLHSDVDKDIDKDIEKDIDKDIEKDKSKRERERISCTELSGTTPCQQTPESDKHPGKSKKNDEPFTPSGYEIILNDGTFYEIPTEKLTLWDKCFPSVDVDGEIRKIIAWSDANKAKRKTRKGVERFINSWLSREQDKGGRYQKGNGRQKEAVDLDDYLEQRINGGSGNDNTGTGFTDYPVF